MHNEMSYIYMIYKEGSFSKAAEKLYLTQSALSMAIQKIERELKTPLLDRSKRPISLTLAGEIYIKKYLEINRLEIEILKEINDLDNLSKGELSLGGTQYILSHILLPVFSKFQKNYPQINMNIIECSSELLNSNLLNGEIDLCLKCEDISSPFSSQGFAFKDTLILAVPKTYINNFKLPEYYFLKEDILNSNYLSFKNLPLEFIEKIPLIILSKGNNLHDRVKMIANENNLNLNITLEVSQLVTAFHLAIAGLGATFATDLLIEKNFNDNLIYYKIDSPLSIREFNFVTREKGYIPKAVLKFIEIGKEILN